MHASVSSRLHFAYSAALAVAVTAALWVPALGDSGWTAFPAPLDDVYIHYDFARAAASGHPFEWIASQGYSSGETAPLYAAVLAIGYAMGFRGAWIGAWTAAVALASLVVLLHAVRALLDRSPPWAAFVASALAVSAPVVGWSLASGMEVALFAAIASWAVVLARRACDASALRRAAAQRWVGWTGALLVLTRPEGVVLVAPLAVMVARHARGHSAIAALLRCAGPAAATVLFCAGVNALATGSPQAAGAQLKLLSSNPYLSDVDRARETILNLAHLEWQVLDAGPPAWPRPWPFVLVLAALGVLARRTRWVSIALLAAAVAWTLLVSYNGAARYQNFRYYAPSLLLVLVAGAVGLGAMARNRVARLPAVACALAAVAFALPRWPAQIAHFRAAARNIREQQVVVGRKLASVTEPGARILVGDAGAIPYTSGRGAIDALGLGGYRSYPFARAAPHGEAAIVELLEHLAPAERPTHLALYPNWFPGITSSFGRELDRVTIEGNVICGGPTKVIYAADWSALGGREEPLAFPHDELDVADIESERAHAYELPAPGGFTVLAVRALGDGTKRFDGGRVLAEGQRERFVVRGWSGTGRALRVVRARIEAAPEARIEVELARAGTVIAREPLARTPGAPDAWEHAEVRLPVAIEPGDVVSLAAAKAGHRSFHVWVLPAEGEAGAQARP
jgi:hypothetical protein